MNPAWKGPIGNRFAVITAFLGETRNRYMVYQGNRTLAEKFAMAKTIKGVAGLELCYPPASLRCSRLTSIQDWHHRRHQDTIWQTSHPLLRR